MTVAPLVIKDKVIVGVAGGEYGIRGFIVAYNAHTGKEAWRFYTTAGPGDPGRDSPGVEIRGSMVEVPYGQPARTILRPT